MAAPREHRIAAVLRENLAPTDLRIVDDSARHAGHAGAAPGGETHFSGLVVSEQFTGLSRPERWRLVYALLQPEFDTGLHALSLNLRTPAEHASTDPN